MCRFPSADWVSLKIHHLKLQVTNDSKLLYPAFTYYFAFYFTKCFNDSIPPGISSVGLREGKPVQTCKPCAYVALPGAWMYHNMWHSQAI